jgi:hypothetical protein
MANNADIGVLDILIVYPPHPWHPYAYYDGGATIAVTSTDISAH